MQQARSRRLAPLRPPQRSGEQRYLQLFHLFIKVGTTFRDQDLLLRRIAMRQQTRRQMARLDFFATYGDDKPLDQVFKLANVSRPAVLLEDLLRIRS